MLIRTQDKNRLINLNHIQYFDVNDGELRAAIIESDVFMILGKYSTEEKALDILDKIQDAYKRQERVNQFPIEGYGLYESGYVGCEVFQMPQDEEV